MSTECVAGLRSQQFFRPGNEASSLYSHVHVEQRRWRRGVGGQLTPNIPVGDHRTGMCVVGLRSQ